MRLFIYEDLCGGGAAEIISSPSLRTEGEAMLTAIVTDVAAQQRYSHGAPIEIVTLWDRRLGRHPLVLDAISNVVEIVEVESAEASKDVFLETVTQCDSALVIAPECDNRLAQLCAIVEQSSCRSLNSSSAAIRLCTDKLHLSKHLQQHQMQTIPTWSVEDLWRAEAPLGKKQEFVVKPRDGAGSQGISLLSLSSVQELPESLRCKLICQPFLAGEACSVGSFYDPVTGRLVVFPSARQHLSSDGHFTYLGGSLPVERSLSSQVQGLVQDVVNVVVGLRGYFGIDFIWDDNQRPVLVEINPRLTTSYVGYRAMTQSNLAELFFRIQLDHQIQWENSVSWTPQGTLSVKPLTETELERCRT